MIYISIGNSVKEVSIEEVRISYSDNEVAIDKSAEEVIEVIIVDFDEDVSIGNSVEKIISCNSVEV